MEYTIDVIEQVICRNGNPPPPFFHPVQTIPVVQGIRMWSEDLHFRRMRRNSSVLSLYVTVGFEERAMANRNIPWG